MAKETATKDYRQILRDAWSKRLDANPAYSLRRFARQLQVSPATLSGVLSGKRNLSLKTVEKVVDRLGLSPNDARVFSASVVQGRYSVGFQNALQAEKHPAYADLSEEQFAIIADWYHYAIWVLTSLPGMGTQPAAYAKHLGIHVTQAREAIERLKRVGMLEVVGQRLAKSHANVATTSNVPSRAIRSRHKQILKLAEDALENVPLENRDMSGVTMAIDPSLIPEAKRRIAQFRRELCAFLESGKPSQIFELSVQLFPLSKKGPLK